MTKDELITALKQLSQVRDIEAAHEEADKLLLQYIDDGDITDAYHNIHMWYA